MTRLPLSLVVLLLLARPASGQEGAVVRGVVVDSATGEPVAGALVAVGAERRASTDGEGRFTLCGLPDGESVVRARTILHDEREEPVVLASGDTARLSVALRRSGVIRIRDGSTIPPEGLLIVDGVRVFHSWSGCETAPPGMPPWPPLDSDQIDSVEVMKGRQAVARYGPEAKHGALVITTKRKAVRPAP